MCESVTRWPAAAAGRADDCRTKIKYPAPPTDLTCVRDLHHDNLRLTSVRCQLCKDLQSGSCSSSTTQVHSKVKRGKSQIKSRGADPAQSALNCVLRRYAERRAAAAGGTAALPQQWRIQAAHKAAFWHRRAQMRRCRVGSGSRKGRALAPTLGWRWMADRWPFNPHWIYDSTNT